MNEDEEGPASARPAMETPPKAVDGAQPQGPDAAGRSASMTGNDFQVYIGRGLRAVFDDVAKQPIPDRFLDLMKKLG